MSKSFYYLAVLNAYDNLVNHWKITLMIYSLEMSLVALGGGKTQPEKHSLSGPIIKADRICIWKMLVTLCEKVCRKSSEMKGVYWVEVEYRGKETERHCFTGRAEIWVLIFSVIHKQVNYLLFTRHCTRVKVTKWIRHRPWNLSTEMLKRKPQKYTGKDPKWKFGPAKEIPWGAIFEQVSVWEEFRKL